MEVISGEHAGLLSVCGEDKKGREKHERKYRRDSRRFDQPSVAEAVSFGSLARTRVGLRNVESNFGISVFWLAY
jgi:hypothetical protein